MGTAIKVVVACMDGTRMKGYVFNFSAIRDRFNLFPEPTSPQTDSDELQLVELKAIFFVKDFAGNRERKDAYRLAEDVHGRKLEVTFSDGEKLIGTTEAYNPKRLGFFMFPADSGSNNSRIFVVNANVRAVKQL